MGCESFSLSLAPSLPNTTTYVVLDDEGEVGRVYRDIENQIGLDRVINDLLVGQFIKPATVVAFNTAICWSCDVSENIAWEVLKRSVAQGKRLTEGTRKFAMSRLGEETTLLAENAAL